SAIRIAAARPASPPPTIAILVPLLAMLENSSQQSTRTYESNCRVDADEQQENSKANAGVAGQTLRALANGDAPINQKQPDTVCQMPHRRRDSDQVDYE